MGELSSAAKVVMVLGITLLLANLLTGASLSEWNNLRDTLQTSVTWPTFIDPFQSTGESAFPAVPDPPVIHGGVVMSWVGCPNTTAGRHGCILSNDGDSSYVAFYSTDPNHGFGFNWSNPKYIRVQPEDVRRIEATLVCRTDSANSSTVKLEMFWDAGLFFPAVDLLRFTCPIGQTYQTTRAVENFPDGVPCAGSPCDPLLGWGTLYIDDGSIFTGTPTGRVTFIRLDIYVATTTGAAGECAPPEGAWFPTLDAVACAIIGFANLVWKGILWFINGVIFIGQVIFEAVSFVGRVAVAASGALIASFAAIFNLGAPSPVQEIIDILVIGMLVFLAFLLVFAIRGSGPV